MKKNYLLLICIIIFVSCKKEEYINPNSIISWGDSLTKGSGGGSVSYPKKLAELTGRDVINEGVNGATSTSIKNKMFAAPNLHSYPTIIWAGRNNYMHSDTILNDIASMVNSLGHSHYLILGIINGDTPNELKGAVYYKRIKAINDTLAARYGLHYLDIKPYLISKRDSTNMNDVQNAKNDVIPYTLRSDFLHLNNKGYGYVAEAIYTKYDILVQ